MAFVDEVNVELRAGDGGHGVVRWRREKFAPLGGPAGGNGGKGGDAYLETISDITVLGRYRGRKILHAGNGSDGGSGRRQGRNGDDLVFRVPVGSFITNERTGQTYDLTRLGRRIRILRGGQGGRGNASFVSSRNRSPRQATQGESGERGPFTVELRLIVDIGLIGLPNAGKSSLLNALTAARSKVGSYPFTTLEPNLGMLDGLVVADIPGLIEGASEGKGLGTKFLRHIERTKMLCHCISLEHLDVARAYRSIRAELENYGRGLSLKREVIVLTKSDLVDSKTIQDSKAALSSTKTEVLSCSIFDRRSIDQLRHRLLGIVKP